MKDKKAETAAPFVTRDNLWEDIGFTPSEAAELKVRSAIYMDLMDYIRQRGFTQAELVKLLHIHQPDASNLMNGRVSKFSIGKLIQFAAKLDIDVSVTVILPKFQILKAVVQKPKAKKRVALAA